MANLIQLTSHGKPRRGGSRPGAGRPANSGKYGEPTAPVRVPASWAAEIEEKKRFFAALWQERKGQQGEKE